MRTEKGAVAPNTIGWAAAMIPHLKRLGVKHLQVLVFENVEDQLPDLLAVQAAVPGIRFTVRIYAENIITFDPEKWAEACRRRVNVLLAVGLNLDGVIPGNEFNIEVPKDRPELATDWRHQVRWLQAFARTWHFLPSPALWLDLHLPALSPMGPGWTDGLDAYKGARLGDMFHIMDAHCYPGTERAYLELLARWPFQRVAITEFNDIDPETYLASLPLAVETADWFILVWIDPPAGSPQVDLLASPYYEGFARAGRIEILPEETSMALKDQYPEAFAEWDAAGGVEANFRKHLLGIGAMAATKEDIDFLSNEAVSAVAQLKGTLDAFLA